MPKASKKERAPKQKKEKKVKDPNAPKGALGAYMFFCKDQRDQVKKEHPDWGVAEIGKHLGAEWKNLTDEEKQPYVDQAKEDKERYKKAMEEYNAKKEAEKEEEEYGEGEAEEAGDADGDGDEGSS
jgi:hypothetical protein